MIQESRLGALALVLCFVAGTAGYLGAGREATGGSGSAIGRWTIPDTDGTGSEERAPSDISGIFMPPAASAADGTAADAAAPAAVVTWHILAIIRERNEFVVVVATLGQSDDKAQKLRIGDLLPDGALIISIDQVGLVARLNDQDNRVNVY